MGKSKGTDRTKWDPKSRSRKRQKHHKLMGNRLTKNLEAEKDTTFTGASAKKIRLDDQISSNASHFYVILAFSSVFGTLSQFVKCKKFDGDISFERSHNTYGLGFQLHAICDCSEEKINSCPKIGDVCVNRKSVFVMRLLGVGIHGINLFCSMMDITSTISNKTFYATMENVSLACRSVFDKSKRLQPKSKKKVYNKKCQKKKLRFPVTARGPNVDFLPFKASYL